MNASIKSTKAIMLRRVDYGEADKIITFISSDFGKLNAIAKGVRKQKSKMAGGIELFSTSEIQFIKGRSDISTLTSTRLIKYYSNIVKNLERTQLGYYMLKKIDKYIEQDEGKECFEILKDVLAALNNDKIDMILSDLSFKMRLLQYLGNLPDFSISKNGNKLSYDDRFEFDYDSMTFVPEKDGKYDKNHIKIMKLLAFNSISSISLIKDMDLYVKQLQPLINTIDANILN